MDRYVTHNSCWLVDPDAKVAARIPREDAENLPDNRVAYAETNGWFSFERIVIEDGDGACCGRHSQHIQLLGDGVPRGRLSFWPLAEAGRGS